MMRARTKLGLAGVAVAAVMLLGAPTAASAHHSDVAGSAVCNTETGLFDISWTVTNWQPGNPATVISSTPDIVPAGTVIDTSASFAQAGVTPGTYSLKVKAGWANGTKSTNAGTVVAEGACSVPTPEPTPTATPTPTPVPTVEPTAVPTPSPTETAPAVVVPGSTPDAGVTNREAYPDGLPATGLNWVGLLVAGLAGVGLIGGGWLLVRRAGVRS